MKSRFLRGNSLPTLNIIASSKNSEQSFLESFIESKRKNENKSTLIVDEPQWVVDSRKVTDEWFYVAIGNKFLANEVIPKDSPENLLSEYRARGYSLLKVPIAYYDNFIENIDGALTDIAGIATASSLKYISGIRWNEIKSKDYVNPFVKEIIEVGNAKDDVTQYSDFFDLSKVDRKWIGKPLYIHLDMSTSGDKTGIAGTWIAGKRPKIDGENSSKELFFRLAFSVAIKAPKGYEISFDKNRAFIRWLREQGFRIRGVSCDTYMSAQIRQQLSADNFEVSTVSVDRLDPTTKQCLPYAYLKSTIYDRRLVVYDKCDFLTEEVLGLERESDGHVNHPMQGTQGCFTGDTKVSLVDGRELSMIELVEEFSKGKNNYVYSMNEQKKIIEPKLIEKAWCTIKDAELVEVELDNGSKIRCTPNHKFMLRDGLYREAKDLVEGDPLMPLYRKFPTEVVSMKNYRMYYEPIEDAWHYEHRKFATEVLDEKYLVHHKNCNCRDNSPSNLIWCSKEAHQKIHSELSTGAHSDEANKKRSQSLSKWYKENHQKASEKNRKARITQLGFTKDSYDQYKQEKDRKMAIQREYNAKIKEQALVKKLEKENRIKQIESLFNVSWDNLSNNEKDSYAVKFQRYCHPETGEAIVSAVKEGHKLGKYENAYIALNKCNEESKLLKQLIPEIDKQKFKDIFGVEYDELPNKLKPSYTVKYRKILSKTILNHKVVSVKKLSYTEDVYDLTIQDNHNFALSSGVFVHNSKDSIDAVCGSVWNASQHADEYAYEYGEDIELSLNVSEKPSVESFRQQISVDFEEALKQIHDPLGGIKQKDSFLDFGFGKAQVLGGSSDSTGICIL